MPSLLALLAVHGIRGTISYLHTRQTTEPLTLLPVDRKPRQQYAFVRRRISRPPSQSLEGRGENRRGGRINSSRKHAALNALWITPRTRSKPDVFFRVYGPVGEMEEAILPAGSRKLSAYRKVGFGDSIKREYEDRSDDEEEEEERKQLPHEVWLAKQGFSGENGHRFRPTKRLAKLTEEEAESLRDRKVEIKLAKMKDKAVEAREKKRNKQKKIEAKRQREDREIARRETMKREKARQEKEDSRTRTAEWKRVKQEAIDREKLKVQQRGATPSRRNRVGNVQPFQESDTTLASNEHPDDPSALKPASANHMRTRLSRPLDSSSTRSSFTCTAQKSSAKASQKPQRSHNNSVSTAVGVSQASNHKGNALSPNTGLESPVSQQPDIEVDILTKFDYRQGSPASSNASTIRAVLPYPEHAVHGKPQDLVVHKSASFTKRSRVRTKDHNSLSRPMSSTCDV